MARKVTVILVFMFSVSFFIPTLANEGGVIGPIEGIEDIFLLDGHQWCKASDLSESEGTIMQLAYIRGFWDALSYFDLACPKIDELRQEYHGMTLKQILDTLNKFYTDHPQWQEWPPATVMFYVIPRLRKGLSPVDSILFRNK
jgi:hypothetical protein